MTTSGTNVRVMFDRIAGNYDTANRVMSVGVDLLWRKRAMKPLLAGLGDAPCILDLGAGTLDGALAVARKKPGARVAAADFAREMLRVGSKKTGARGAGVEAHAADGHHLPYGDGVFDAALSAFCVRNLVNLPQALCELRRVMRPGGTLVILEFFRPLARRPFMDGFYNARVLPLLGWAVSGDREAYRYLPASIDRFASRSEFETRLHEAGFAATEGEELFPAGVASLVVAR